MGALDLAAMHALKFLSQGNVVVEDGEFSIRMEFGSRESLISTIKSYTISRGVDYTVYESESQTFYAKCKGYANLIRKKGCWDIKRYNGKYTYTMGTISQDHVKLDSNTIANVIRPLIETYPSIKVNSIIAEVQSRLNYIVSHHKPWLANFLLNSVELVQSNVCQDAKVSYSNKNSKSGEVNGVRVLHRVFGSFYPCITTFRYCKPLVQVDDIHLYEKYNDALLVVVAQDKNQNIVPIAFAIVEGETADAYVITRDGVGIISDRYNSIDAAVARSNGAWLSPRAWHIFCIRHTGSDFLRRFKFPYLHKLVVNIGYSRIEQEYNNNYQRLNERGEADNQ
ncbi:hypothetical protein Ahy_B06g082052 [Arachis hypogaea]|uniref:Transposase MuDR plant domain-containing protein n=1 Tax=Arachis hypogaea TaxID=3818 RepID=A0A444YMR0_ARAHY|nr:hypothetical protein Ahy_B06g082052 [Arachis hypogaea]